MKIIELRIGNIVGFKNRDDCYCVVTDLSSAGGIHLIRKFYDGDEDDQPEVIDDITPIPLTTVILDKTFNIVQSSEKMRIYCDKKFSLIFYWDGERLSTSFWEGNEKRYIHQLQNFYFALTGEELTILNTL